MEATAQPSEHRYFDLWLERDRAGVSLVVTNSPAGQSSAPIHQAMPASFDSTALDGMGMAELVALGSALWSWLFAARDVAELWRASCNGVGSPLLRLTMGDAELAAWPWELLYDTGAGRFIALEAGSAVVRRLPLPLAVAAEPVAAPVRVLFTGCSPVELPPIDLAPEWRAVEGAATGQGWTLAGSADQASLGRLVDELAADAQVWHFAGHGTEEALLFRDDQGRACRVDAFTVGALLAGAGVRVAVVNACRAGAGGGSAASIAGALLRAGVPVVVAMQSAVPEAAALAFSGAFYRGLALGKPVELAVASGRRAMLALGQPLGASWWMPVLASRAQTPTRLTSSAAGDAGAPDQPPLTSATGRSAISQGGVAISGQVGGSVVVLSSR